MEKNATGDRLMKKNIYLIFTNTGTLFTRTISLYTKADYNHASLALDPSLHETYSFGRKNPRNPFFGGFVKEKMNDHFFKRSDCLIYSYTITRQQELKLKHSISKFEKQKDAYHYNLLGLLGVIFNKPIQRKNAYFCSQFVAYILEDSGIVSFNKPSALITPEDLQKIPKLNFVYKGKLIEAVS